MSCPRELRDVLMLATIDEQGDHFRGCRWGEKTRFAVLDIDQGGRYHNREELAALRAVLEAAELRGRLYQSSKSGGWWLYVFFDAEEDSREVQQLLKSYLQANGYEIKGGALEIFPSGNGLRLPLQAGFAWLEENIRREELTGDEAIERFVSDLERYSNNWSISKRLIQSHLQSTAAAAGELAQEPDEAADYADLPDGRKYRLIVGNYEKGRYYWANGLSAERQRHEAVYCIQHYLWHGDEAAGVAARPGRRFDSVRAALIWEWLQTKHNGYCRTLNGGHAERLRQHIVRTCEWRPENRSVSYPVSDRMVQRQMQTGLTREQLIAGNDKRRAEARKRISDAVAVLYETNQPISISAVSELSGAKRETVRKHRDLLAKWPGDQIPGVVTDLCSSVSEKKENPVPVSDLESSEPDQFEVFLPVIVCLAPLPVPCAVPLPLEFVSRTGYKARGPPARGYTGHVRKGRTGACIHGDSSPVRV